METWPLLIYFFCCQTWLVQLNDKLMEYGALGSTRSRLSYGVSRFKTTGAQKTCLEMILGFHFHVKSLRHVRYW